MEGTGWLAGCLSLYTYCSLLQDSITMAPLLGTDTLLTANGDYPLSQLVTQWNYPKVENLAMFLKREKLVWVPQALHRQSELL